MNDSVVLPMPMPMPMPNVRIGISGLPHLTSHLVQGGLYVLVAETASARFPLLASSLESSLNDGRQCCVVIPGNPESFISRLETFGDMKAKGLATSDKFALYVMQAEFSKKMFRFGAERFTTEMVQLGVADGCYLVIDQADDLISLHDASLAIEQVDVLSRWLVQHSITALLVFTRVTAAHAVAINALMDYLTGIVRLGGDEDGLRLNFEYWQSPDGTIASRIFPLVTLDNNYYDATARIIVNEPVPESTGTGRVSVPVETASNYYCMDNELLNLASELPGTWQVIDTLVGMLHATSNNRKAIAILSFEPNTSLRQLAEAVHALRINLGQLAQIIIREKNISLRYQNEALLLRLGANLVIHRDVPLGRIPLLLGAVIGQIFSRDVNINFDDAMASASPSSLKGYQIPRRFVREVELLQARAEVLNVPCALIICTPVQDIDMLAVLSAIQHFRSGDLVTADNDVCYIFLNACQHSVIMPTLERLIGCSVEAVFESVQTKVLREELTQEILNLLERSELEVITDYSRQILSINQPEQDEKSGADGAPTFENDPSTKSSNPSVQRAQFDSAAPQPDALRDDYGTDAPSLYQQSTVTHKSFGKREVPRAKRSASKSLEVDAV